MRNLVLALLLAAVLSFLITAIQARLRKIFERRRAAVWIVPLLLTAIFGCAALLVDVWSWALLLLVLAYTAAPVGCVWVGRRNPTVRPSILDFAAILLLWLPLEFAAGAGLIPRPAQGFLHSVAYGIAILLALVLFLGFRGFQGLKYNLPRESRDGWLPLAGFAISAPVLIVLGVAIGFIPAPHWPVQRAGAMAVAAPVIFAGTALPEEILFRSLIQNLLMQRLGAGWRTLLAASIIFGCAHLDNGPQALPNWRYAIVAAVAGVAYGAVFQRASTVLSSAGLHMLVDWTKHYFF
ncbi:MAG TPA: CPBP family intramembrane glutamic endopeptidase [Bryobacteraceae bacterium]|jgi:membrane protease YdiL (CAAX protease family)